MPDSFPFPVFSGLLQPKHQKQIGNAIWLFLWCISATTCEEVIDGVSWGKVLGGKPINTQELADELSTSTKTIKRWINTLEEGGYIKTIRAPYGLIYKVHNSKKYVWKNSKRTQQIIEQGLDKYVQSEGTEQTKVSEPKDRDQTLLSTRSDSTVQSNKDILDINIITTTDADLFSKNPRPVSKTPFIELLDAYCELHNKLDFHVNAKEREFMSKMVSGDIPLSFTIPTMKALYKDKRDREGKDFEQPSSFGYYVKAIEKAWKNTQPVGSPTAPQTAVVSKQQSSIDELQRRLQEVQASE